MSEQYWWHPDRFARKVPYLQARADIMAKIRNFFVARGYLEVQTPALQISPCMEPHIQAFKTELLSADMQARSPYYLHTSPEFAMKKLLVAGLPKIFQLATVFRNAEGAHWHSPEFCLLEWYQTGMDYMDLMQESIDLVRAVCPGVLRAHGRTADPHQEWEIITVVDAVRKYAGIDIANSLNDIDHLRGEAQRIGVYVSPDDDWDNALLKIIMDKVENVIGGDRPAILYDYPVSMAALSRPKPQDARFAERFEIYACGVELCNAFGELTDARVQRKRFLHDVHVRKKIYGDDYPVDDDFLRALEHGLPQCSGNAMGIDRLIMLVTGADDIDLVQAAPVRY